MPDTSPTSGAAAPSRRPASRAADLTGYPDLVAIYLGLRPHTVRPADDHRRARSSEALGACPDPATSGSVMGSPCRW